MSSTTTEYERILRNYDRIVSQLTAARSSGELADKLYSRKLISHSVHMEATNMGVAEAARIRSLIEAVHAKVKVNEHNYCIFLEILKEISGLEDVVQLLHQDTKLQEGDQQQQFHQQQGEIIKQPGVMEQMQTNVIGAAVPTMTPPVNPANTQPQAKATQKMKVLEASGSTNVSTLYPSTMDEHVITDTSAQPDYEKDAGAPTLTPPVSPANTQPQPKSTQRKRALETSCDNCHSDTNDRIEQLQSDYKALVNRAKMIVKEKRVTVDEFRTTITLFPSSMKNQEEQRLYIGKHLSEINNAQSIEELFSLLNLYVWDYLSYQLLQCIVRDYGDDGINRMMQQYVIALDEFKKETTLQDFLSVQAKKRCPQISDTLREELKEVNFKHRRLTLESSLYDIDQFRLELAECFSLPDFAVITAGIKPGCVTTVWLMSLPAVSVIQERIQRGDIEFLLKHDIVELRIDGRTFYPLSTDQLESATAFTTPNICDQYSSPGTPVSPAPSALLMTAQSMEETITPPSEVPKPQASPPESRAPKMQEYRFDILDALLDEGVPHVVMMIISFLDSRTLEMAEQVSSVWRDFMEDLPVWKSAVESNIASIPLWMQLFQKRGWQKYISQEIPHCESINYLYRQLLKSISKDIHSLNTNWQRGLYTLTRIETGSRVLCLQFDSVKIISGHPDSTIKIWDKDTLKLLKILTGHKKAVQCLQFTDDLLLSGSSDNSIKVWNIQRGRIVNDLLHHKDDVNALKFNSELLVTGSDDKTVVVCVFNSPSDITRKMVLEGHQGAVYAVDISNTFIISGSSDYSIKVWDSSNGRLLHTLKHSGQVLSLQCRGSLIVSGCGDGTIRVWDCDTGSCLREWRGHEHFISSVTFDDERIVTGSYDKTVKVWSMSAVLEPSSSTDVLCVATLKEHSSWVSTVQMDEFQVVSGGHDGMINIHDFLAPIPPYHNLGPLQLI